MHCCVNEVVCQGALFALCCNVGFVPIRSRSASLAGNMHGFGVNIHSGHFSGVREFSASLAAAHKPMLL